MRTPGCAVARALDGLSESRTGGGHAGAWVAAYSL